MKNFKFKRTIELYILVIAALAILMLWPFGIIHRNRTTKSQEQKIEESQPVIEGTTIVQHFITEGTRLQSIDVYICNDMAYRDLIFRIYDGNMQELITTTLRPDGELTTPGFLNVPFYLDVDRGQAYYLEIIYPNEPLEASSPIWSERGKHVTLTVGLEDHSTTTSNCGYLSYGGNEDFGHNVVARYNYYIDLMWWQNFVITIVVILMAAAAVFVCERFIPWGKWDIKLDADVLHRIVLTVTDAAVSLYLLYLIDVVKLFDDKLISLIWYSMGVIILSVYLLFVIWKKSELLNFTPDSRKVRFFLQSVCFAGAIYHCCMYWNGLYDIFHEYSTRRMLIWFAMGILVSFEPKKLLKIWNLIYLVISSVVSGILIHQYIGSGENELLYKLNAHVIIIGGLAIVNIVAELITSIKNKTIRIPNIPYLIATSLLMILLCVFNNTNTWVFYALSLVVILTLRIMTDSEYASYSKIMCDAVIFNFVWVVGYCLIHRPYHAYRYYRYGMIFHTVTVTAEYLSLVLAAVLVKFIVEYHAHYRDKVSVILVELWKEILTVAFCAGYILFTLSRTAIVTAAALVFALFIYDYYVRIKEEKILGGAVKSVLVLGISALVLFSSVFTLQRTIPAVNHTPVRSDIEFDEHTILSATDADSAKYITLRRFGFVAGHKLLGLDDGTEARISRNAAAIEACNNILSQIGLFMYEAEDSSIHISNDNGLDILFSQVTLKDIACNAHFDISDAPALLIAEDDGELMTDVSNGRFDIFRTYISNWNLFGHEDQEVEMTDGSYIFHAHNSFLQAIHDFGIIGGFYVIIFGMYTLIYGAMRYRKERDFNPYRLFTPAIMVAFATAGMTEWMFHICNPMGWMLFMSIVPLLFEVSEKENVTEKSC